LPFQDQFCSLPLCFRDFKSALLLKEHQPAFRYRLQQVVFIKQESISIFLKLIAVFSSITPVSRAALKEYFSSAA
jgi:hypothetical protein